MNLKLITCLTLTFDLHEPSFRPATLQYVSSIFEIQINKKKHSIYESLQFPPQMSGHYANFVNPGSHTRAYQEVFKLHGIYITRRCYIRRIFY